MDIKKATKGRKVILKSFMLEKLIKFAECSNSYLNVLKHNQLEFSVSSSEINYWKKVCESKTLKEDIRDKIPIEQFTVIIKGMSIFHHFVERDDIIEAIKDKFI
jgi:hypothetical protein